MNDRQPLLISAAGRLRDSLSTADCRVGPGRLRPFLPPYQYRQSAVDPITWNIPAHPPCGWRRPGTAADRYGVEHCGGR